MNNFKDIKNLIIEGGGSNKENVNMLEVQKTYISVIDALIPLLEFKLIENNEISLKQIINLTGKPGYEQNINYPLSKIDKDFSKYTFSMKVGVAKYEESFLYLCVSPIGIGYAIFNEPTVHLTNFNWLVDDIALTAKDREKAFDGGANIKTSISESVDVTKKFIHFDNEEIKKIFELFNLEDNFIKELRTIVNLNEGQVKDRLDYINDYLLGDKKIYTKEELMEVIYYV